MGRCNDLMGVEVTSNGMVVVMDKGEGLHQVLIANSMAAVDVDGCGAEITALMGKEGAVWSVCQDRKLVELSGKLVLNVRKRLQITSSAFISSS